MRAIQKTILALCAAGPLAAAQAPTAPTAPPRDELSGLASVFEQAVRQSARPGFHFMALDAPRSFYLPGVGAVIVLSPRALPAERRPVVRRKVEAVPYEAALRELEARRREARSPEEEQALALSIANLRRLQLMHARDSQERARQEAMVAAFEREAERAVAVPAPRVADVRELERHVLAMQEEAEQARREAEERLEQLTHEVRLRMPPAPPEAPDPTAPPAPPTPPSPAAAPVAPRSPAPWAFWFEVEEVSERRTPEATVAAVRQALTRALENQGPLLTGLPPQEGIVVAVDLVSGEWSGRAPSRRTLVARVAKKDLDARAAGKLGSEDFAKKVQLLEY